MKHIRSLEDAQAAIREIDDFISYWRTENIDFKRRRIKNASPSEDLYDYVVRKELDEVKEYIVSEGGGLTKEFYSVVFSNDGRAAKESPASAGYVVQRDSSPVRVTFLALKVEGSVDFEFNFMQNYTNQVLSSNVVVPPTYAQGTVLSYASFNVKSFSKNDVITLNVYNNIGVSRITIQMYFEG